MTTRPVLKSIAHAVMISAAACSGMWGAVAWWHGDQDPLHYRPVSATVIADRQSPPPAPQVSRAPVYQPAAADEVAIERPRHEVTGARREVRVSRGGECLSCVSPHCLAVWHCRVRPTVRVPQGGECLSCVSPYCLAVWHCAVLYEY